MRYPHFHVLILGALPEADGLFDREIFRNRYPCVSERVTEPAHFVEAMRDPSVDLILNDIKFNGVQVLQSVLDQRPMCPMVMVADVDQADSILAAKRMGLQRYVIRLEDDALNTDLLAEEAIFALKQLVVPSSIDHPTLDEFFRFALYHNVRQPFFVIAASHRLLYANASGRRLVKTVHGHELCHGESYEHFPLTGSSEVSISHLDEALQGSLIEVEQTYEQLPEDERYREVLYQPVQDYTGEVVGVSISCKNIGARRQAQQSLKRQEDTFWSFFESVPLPLKTVGPDLLIRNANRALADLFGHDNLDTLEGAGLDALLCPDDRDKVRNALTDVFDGTTPYSQCEARYQRPDGETVWVNHIGFPMRGIGISSPIPIILVLCVDITRQKEAEAREKQSMRMQAIAALAAGVAHDFKNVLAIVTTYSELLRAELHHKGEHGYAAYADKILTAVERGGALTHQLMTFGKEDEGSNAQLDLNHHVRELSSLLERLVGEYIDLQTDLAVDLPNIQADSCQLDQVLMNLAINARDAMPFGGMLHLRTRRELVDAGDPSHADLQSGEYVVLEVSDTGEGMDEQTQRHVFDPFFTTKGRRGTGLGLATVCRIVENSGGRIYVNSEAGQGTTFTIYVPALSSAIEGQR